MIKNKNENVYLSIQYLNEIENMLENFFWYEKSNVYDEEIWPFFDYVKKNYVTLFYKFIKINNVLRELKKIMKHDCHDWIYKFYCILEKILDNNDNRYIMFKNDNTRIELD